MLLWGINSGKIDLLDMDYQKVSFIFVLVMGL